MSGAEDLRRNAFLERLRGGEATFMLVVRGSRTADVARIARSTGHHALLLDLEHSTMSIDVAAQISAAAGDLGLTPLVRLPERDYGSAGRLLDAGAQGIVAARVETADDARTIARACRFPPAGQRSQLASVPQLGMRPTPARVLNPVLDAGTVVQILVETPAALDQVDDIAAVEGVDMIAIGANDLTAELGIAGQYDSPLLRDAVSRAAGACTRHGVLLMLGGVGDLGIVGPLLDLGVCPLFVTGTDTDLLYSAAAARVGALETWHRSRVPVTAGDLR